MKGGCNIHFILNSANVTCRSTDISKYFRESLGLRDNESRLYILDNVGLALLYVLYISVPVNSNYFYLKLKIQDLWSFRLNLESTVYVNVSYFSMKTLCLYSLEAPDHIFLISPQKNICCGYSLEAPQWGASNEYPQHMFLWKNLKKYFPWYSSYLELLWDTPVMTSTDIWLSHIVGSSLWSIRWINEFDL